MLSVLAVVGAGGIALWLLRPHLLGKAAGVVGALPAAYAFGWLIDRSLDPEAPPATTSVAWAPELGLRLDLRLDGLAVFFGLIIAGIGTAIAVYAAGYFRNNARLGYFYLLFYAFMASMLGLVFADNLLALFSFWEATSITSFLLIGFNHTSAASRAGARRSLVVTGLGGLAMLAGFVVVGQQAGTYTISELIARDLTTLPGYVPALILILIGAFTKSAQFPFHFWLPGAMAAPTPASAYLHSATMVKAGIYLLARLHPAMADHDLWLYTLAIVGGITMLVGAVQAPARDDLKALLAYATVSQLGVLVFILAFDNEAVYPALVAGIAAHALYKGPLFMVAGIVDLATGTRSISRLAGLHRVMAPVAAIVVLCGLSMAGLPPLFGFLAKETLLEVPLDAMDHGLPVLGALGLVASAITGALFVMAAFRLIWEPFYRSSDAIDQPASVLPGRTPGVALLAPTAALVVLGTSIPFALGTAGTYLFSPAASAVAGEAVSIKLKLWHGLTPALGVSAVAIAAGAVLFWRRSTVDRAANTLRTPLGGSQGAFDRLYDGSYAGARWTTRFLQDRSLATHSTVVLLATVASLLYAAGAGDRLDAFEITLDRPAFHTAVIAALAIVAAAATVKFTERLSQIISVGVVGVMVTLIFVDFSAPDLALTQLAIDVLTVVLLVLVFYRIPEDKRPKLKPHARIRNVGVATAVGVFGAITTMMVGGTSFADPVSAFYTNNAVPGGEGTNVVNVILVDFRALDTLGEIVVLTIAAIGGFALLRSGRLMAVSTVDGVDPDEADDDSTNGAGITGHNANGGGEKATAAVSAASGGGGD
ncbi:MAG: hydrogen gas-evolving membrane-bound hydrogenase subunit E [Actinomycetota bacterium]